MKNLCAINPYDVDSLIGNYNKKINRTRNPILIYKEDIFPKINNRKTLNSFKKKQINIPILMNNTSNNFVENNKKRFNSNYTEPSVIIDKNAKNKKKYCPKDYLLSVKYLKFLKQEDLRDNNYFERIYRSDSDSDDDENYMIAKLKAKNKLKENLKKIDFDKQLQFLMELDNIPKYVLESNAERIIQSIENNKKFKTERKDLIIHNIYFDWILYKIFHQVEIRNKYNEKISVQNVLNLLEREVTKTQNKIIKYVEEKKKLNEAKIQNLKKQSSLNTRESQYDNEYNFFNKMDRSDYIHFMRLKKKYKLGNISIEDLEKSNGKIGKGKMDQLILEQFIKKKSQGKGIFLNKKPFDYSTFEKSDYSNNFNILNANKFLQKQRNKTEEKENLLSTFNSLLFPSKNTINNKRTTDDWLSNQNTSILDETKRTTNTYNFKSSYDESNKKYNGNFYVVNDDEEDNFNNKNSEKKINDIIKDKVTFNDEKKEKKIFSDGETENENDSKDALFGEKVIKRGKSKNKGKKGKKKKKNNESDSEDSDISQKKKKKKSKSKKNKNMIEQKENNKNDEENINNEENNINKNNNENIENNPEYNPENNINNENNENNNNENNINGNNIENQNNNNIKNPKSPISPKRRKKINIEEKKKSPKKNIESKRIKLRILKTLDNIKSDYDKNEEEELEEEFEEEEEEEEENNDKEEKKENEKKIKLNQYLKKLKKDSNSNYHHSFNPYISTSKRLNTKEQNEFLRKVFFKKKRKEKEKIFLIPEEDLSKVKDEIIIQENKKLIRINMGEEEMRKFIYDHSYLFNNKNGTYYDLKDEILNSLSGNYKKENDSDNEDNNIRRKYSKIKKKKKKNKQYYFEKNGLKLVLNFDLNKYDENEDEENIRKKKIQDEEERLRELSYEVRLKKFFEKIQKLKDEEGYAIFEKELDELIQEQIENSDMGKNKRRELNLQNFNDDLNSIRKEKIFMKSKYGNLLFKNPCEFETKK